MPVLPKGYVKAKKHLKTGVISPSQRGFADRSKFAYGYQGPDKVFHAGEYRPEKKSKDKKVKVRVATYIAEVDSATAAKWKASPVQSTAINTSDKDLANVLVDTIDKIIKDRENSLRVRLRLEMLDALNAALSKVFGGDVNQEVKPV